ncbi:FAD binding domain protein [Hypoxylon sp. FL1857]|nr:FAD binding domain protein [Hypoxylon sp. FL1857]
MKSDSGFKVIIAGGGIAGLTLAVMLERFGLDYVLLESHSAIAPQVGASIGLFPNGLRILDQIGCYEPILDIFKGEILYNRSHNRDKSGKSIFMTYAMSDHLQIRHGYGLLFFDRQQLLQILYDHIQHKERVLLNKKFTTANITDEGVNVTCADGSVFSGTLLVGADGVNSTVRNAMIALGNKLQPGLFDPKEQDSVPCYYKCSFGIAQHVPGWVKGEQHIVYGRGRSQLVVSGPEDRVYWFLFEKLPETKYGKDIPTFTKEDEADFVKKNFDVPITETVTFGRVFSKRLSSTLTPLHENVYKKWFFNRIVTLGDSAHKPNPIGGQGANGAIESCAEFINALMRKRDSRGGTLAGLSTGDLEQVFRETQEARQERAEMVVRAAHQLQALNAYENPLLSTLIIHYLGPLAGKEGIFTRMGGVYAGAAKINALPVPKRAREVPFHDELPAVPVSKKATSIVRGVFVGGMALTLFVSTKAWRVSFSAVEVWAEQAPIVIRWFGENKASKILNVFVSALAIPMLDQDPAAKLHLVNFLSQLISPLLIYTIEGNRVGNQGTLLSLPSLFTAGMQVQGIGRIGPIHAILSSIFTHELPPGRALPVTVARSLIPAITLGFVIPTILIFVPTPNARVWQHWLALWQFAPPLFSVLTNVFSAGLKRWQRGNKSVIEYDEEHDFDCYNKKEVPILKSVYTYAFAVQATAHISTLLYAWTHPGISIAKTFFGLPNPFTPNWNLPTLSAKAATFIKYDMALATVSFVGSNLYSIWDMRRLGYIKTREASKAALAVIAGQFLVGSGATWAGLWYWREDKLASLGLKGEELKRE